MFRSGFGYASSITCVGVASFFDQFFDFFLRVLEVERLSDMTQPTGTVVLPTWISHNGDPSGAFS